MANAEVQAIHTRILRLTLAHQNKKTIPLKPIQRPRELLFPIDLPLLPQLETIQRFLGVRRLHHQARILGRGVTG